MHKKLYTSLAEQFIRFNLLCNSFLSRQTAFSHQTSYHLLEYSILLAKEEITSRYQDNRGNQQQQPGVTTKPVCRCAGNSIDVNSHISIKKMPLSARRYRIFIIKTACCCICFCPIAVSLLFQSN